MQKLCDLHTHSIFSDGSYTPRELVDGAVASGLSAIALCDHNTADGLDAFLAAAEGRAIEAIPATELSVDYGGRELHLIGMFIPSEHFATVNSLMETMQRRKEISNLELIASLAASGVVLDYDYIKRQTPNGRVNRAHIAAELMRIGYTNSVAEGFATLLSPAAGHYKEPKRMTVFEAIDFIRSIGATPVLAHPFLNLSRDELEAFLPQAREAGLVGMECYYSLYDEQTTAEALRLAKKYGIKPSGGSDFHGKNKPDISIGTGRGNLRIPYEWLEALRK